MKRKGKYRLVKGKAIFLLLFPAVLVLGGFFLGSLVKVSVISFNTYNPEYVFPPAYQFTYENYFEFLGSPAFRSYIWTTLRIAFFASLGAVIPGYFFAYVISRTTSRRRRILITFFIGLLFVSTLARIYAIKTLFLFTGPVNQVLNLLGFSEFRFGGTEFIVILGLIHWMFPIAVLSMMGPVKNIDPDLEKAAQTLGADWLKAMVHVTLPLSVPALSAGFLLTFPLGVSAYVIPSILGGGKVLMLANIVKSRQGLLNYPSAGALSLILLLVSMLSIFILNKLLNSMTAKGV